MPRKLTSASSLEQLKGEAKRWLKAIRRQDRDALARFRTFHPNPPELPGLRDVQLALAREHGFSGWAALKAELARRVPVPEGRSEALTGLLSAADRGDPAPVAALLDRFPDLVNQRGNLSGHDGLRTALHFAMNSMNEEVVDLLLARGADPNIRDEGDHAMPLHFAAEQGHLGIVRKLLAQGADPNGEGDGHELGVLGWAVCFEYACHREVAELLLASGARHTMFTAVAMGDPGAIRRIAMREPEALDRRMDRTNQQRRPLHLAIVKRQPNALELLIELGADLEAEDAAGLTPLDLAALRGEREAADRLLAAGARLRLPAAVALGRESDIRRLLQEEPDALRPGGRWDRLIIRASEKASGRVIESLIRAGASVQVRDRHETAIDSTHGYTALHAAAFHGNLEAARVLLTHGANPADREDKYWGSPAGWADYAGHPEIRDLILEGVIDVFDAIAFDRPERIGEIVARDPLALERPFREYINGDGKPRGGQDPAWTPLACAAAAGRITCARHLIDDGASLDVTDSSGRRPLDIAREKNLPELIALLEGGRSRPGRKLRGPDETIADFLRWACLDWRVGGSWRARLNRDADRLLQAHPWLATATLHTAVVGGELDLVRSLLRENPTRASEIGGPRSWPPLLYLCSARLSASKPNETALAMAILLLDHGADPNAFYPGGNADIHYTALTGVLGRGEELASMHPRARALTRLLLERGASPHDGQVLYNVFADNTSRHLLDDEIVWLLELMYEHSIRRGHRADWENPEWPMFDMRGAPSLGHDARRKCGARFLLEGAVDRDLPGMAEWLLRHGAGPNTEAGNVWKQDAHLTLYQQALARGHPAMAELLVRYGAIPTPLERDDLDGFIEVLLRGDHPTATALLNRHPEFLRDHRPLFAAARAGRADTVAFLLDRGVSPDLEDPGYRGQRALHVAATEAVVTLLIERGAEVDSHDAHHDGTPLSWAVWFGNQKMVEVLGRYSRDVWPLTSAGQVERLRRVLEEEPALARVTAASGDTPLMWLPGDPDLALEAARLLVGHGADPSARNAQGLTAAEVAERRGLSRVASFLQEAQTTGVGASPPMAGSSPVHEGSDP